MNVIGLHRVHEAWPLMINDPVSPTAKAGNVAVIVCPTAAIVHPCA